MAQLELNKISECVNICKSGKDRFKTAIPYLLCQIKDETTASAVINEINHLLPNSKDRDVGIEILLNLLPICPGSVLNESAISWMNICLFKIPAKRLNSTTFQFIENLIFLCNDDPNFNKAMMTSLLAKLLQIFVQMNQMQWNDSALKCLKICLQNYPSTCGPFRNKLEEILLRYLENGAPISVLQLAGSTYNLLAQAGGGGENGIIHSQNWSTQFEKLCSIAHSLYQVFFQNFPEVEKIYSGEITSEYCEIPLLDGKTNFEEIVLRLRHVLVFISCMISERFPATKNVPIKKIFTMIKQPLLANSSDMMLYPYVVENQIDVLRLLQSFILSMGPNLLPLSFPISKLLIDSLERSRQHVYHQIYRQYQEVLYEVLTDWIFVIKSGLHDIFHEKLINMIIFDISPVENNVTLNINKEKDKTSKKKAVKQKMFSPVLKNPTSSLFQNNKIKLCQNSVNLLTVVLQHVMLKLNVEAQKLLIATIVNNVFKIQTTPVKPYTNTKCQVALYKALTTVFEQPLFVKQPPLAVVIALLKYSKTTHPEIQRVCAEGLSALEKICQPTCSSLYLCETTPSHNNDQYQEKLNTYEFVEKCLDEDLYVENIEENKIDQQPLTSQKVKIINVQVIKKADLPLSKVETTVVSSKKSKINSSPVVTNGDGSDKNDYINLTKMEENTINIADKELINNIKTPKGDVLQKTDMKTEVELHNTSTLEPPLKKSKTESANVANDASDKNDVDFMVNSFVDVVVDDV